MNKKIFSVGYEIPGDQAEYIDFSSGKSLMDADILVISPDTLSPTGDWVSFTAGGGCYNVEPSSRYKQKISHLRKEIKDHLEAGKNVFTFLTEEKKYTLANGVSSQRKGQHSYSTEVYSNYNFLPVKIGSLVSGSGNHIQFLGNPIFSDFYKKFGKELEYNLYIENPISAEIIFTGKDKTKVLGAVYKVGSGNLIVLPYLNYDYDEFIKTEDGEDHWTQSALKFGYSLVQCLIQIANDLNKSNEKTPPPQWVNQSDFISSKEILILESIKKEEKKIADLTKEISKLNLKLVEEQILKDLLFEQGKPLENAVIKALQILGYQAENYDDGNLELDQIIISPEGHRYIGECEGKNEKDIDITKFRQLSDSINADFAREEVEEKAFGILFGNPQRLTSPDKRTLDFTKKCKISAERDKIALIKTSDLFRVVKYLAEKTDDGFKKSCREAIHNGLGTIVAFPDVPNIIKS